MPAPAGVVGAGVVAALWAGAAGLLGVGLLVLSAWAVTPGDTQAVTALRAVLDGWLLAHHGTLVFPDGRLGLVPLGLTVGVALLLGTAAARTVRRFGAVSWRSKAVLVASATGTYALLPLLVSPLAATATVRPVASQAAGGAAVLALVATAAGSALASGRWARMRAAAAPPVRACWHGAAVGLMSLLGAGALLLTGALVAHHEQVTTVAGGLGLGVADAAALLALSALLAPNAVVWVIAYALGPGFEVGVDTVVSPFTVELGAVPALPWLAALPTAPLAPWLRLLVLLVPLAVGALTGAASVRRLDESVGSDSGHTADRWPDGIRALTAGCAGLLVTVAVTVLAALSGGPLGGGRMSALGPVPWQVGLVAAVELGLTSAVTAWALPPRPGRGR